jgi:hypothetical protein
MHEPMKMRKNSPVINQQKKRLVKFVIAKLKKKRADIDSIFIDKKELRHAGFEGVEYLTAEEQLVVDHGWIIHPILLEYGDGRYRKYGKTLEGLLLSKSNRQNYDRGICVKSEAVKGQVLLMIEIRLAETYEENFILVTKADKIVPCRFAAMKSHNWDEDSPEALALITDSRFRIRECLHR